MLLALDTSTARLGLALYDGERVLAEMSWLSGRRHTAALAPAVADLLARSQTDWEAVQAVAVALGPGSFTSLRVGLAFAKGLCLARGLPLIGVPTLDVTAAAAPPLTEDLLAVLQAGRGRLALVRYRRAAQGWQAVSEPQGIRLKALLAELKRPSLLCGELTAEEQARAAAHPLVRLLSPARCLRRPALLAELAWARWQAGQQDDLAALSPIYLHVAGTPPA